MTRNTSPELQSGALAEFLTLAHEPLPDTARSVFPLRYLHQVRIRWLALNVKEPVLPEQISSSYARGVRNTLRVCSIELAFARFGKPFAEVFQTDHKGIGEGVVLVNVRDDSSGPGIERSQRDSEVAAYDRQIARINQKVQETMYGDLSFCQVC